MITIRFLFNQMRKVFIGTVLISALLCPQGSDAAGQAAVYLREGIGARTMGMGNIGTACNQDTTAAYWNPAALPALDALGIASQTGILSWERSWNFLNVVYPGQRLDGGDYALGVSWIQFSAGEDIEARTTNRPEVDYFFEDSQNTFIFSAASTTPVGIHLGTNVKLINHTLDGLSGSGLGFDLSVFHEINETWQWGLMMQDIYSTIGWDDDYQDRLPMMLRAGVLHRMLEKKLTLAIDLGSDFFHADGSFQEFYYHAGVEYSFMPQLAIRAGVNSGQWTLGLGAHLEVGNVANVRIDYALAGESSEGMGLTHLFSLIINFIAEEKE